MSKISVEQVYQDLSDAVKKQSKLHKQMQEDFEFALGSQWPEADARELEEAGVVPLVINQIKPMVKIISGIERQSRSDFFAYPEGEEDSLLSEIVTRLLKNIVKMSSLDKKFSDQFKEGTIGGLCYIEPYIDYTYDLLNGKMKFRKISADRVFYTDGEEYDLSDRPFVIKMTYDMSKDDLLSMFPDAKKEIEGIGVKKIPLSGLDNLITHIQKKDYELSKDNEIDERDGDGYDLVEYFYKKPKEVFYVGDKQTGKIETTDSKEKAEALVEQLVLSANSQGAFVDSSRFVIIRKNVPELRLKQIVGEVELSDEPAWSYPRYKFYPIFPFFSEVMSVNVKDKTLLVQGLVRGLKDLQLELNMTRTAELRHTKTTANSGWIFPKDAIDKKTKTAFKKFGSSPGFVGEYDPSKTGGVVNPEQFRIRPSPMADGLMSLSQERLNEIKSSGGVNVDLLANDSKSDSGRAILLKQRQGLVMIQESLDNYGETKKLVGRFILSQLGEVYTVESAMKVLGRAFLMENFQRPQVNTSTGEIVKDERGNIVYDMDEQEVALVLNKILTDAEVGKFDVSIGEGAYSETIRYANYLMLTDMATKGIPIPPDVIIQESTLAEGQKKKILSAIAAQSNAINQPQ